MEGFWEVRRIRRELTVAALFLCTAVSIAWCVLLRFPNGLGASTGERMAECAVIASPLVFLCACVLVFVRPRFGYSLGLFASLIALPWFVWTELLLGWNSWLDLNIGYPLEADASAILAFTWLKILSMALIVFSILCSSLRLVPARLSLRKSPLCQRTWPAFALGFLVLAGWFVHSAIPYSLPVIGFKGAPPEFRVLHVEKQGIHLRETQVSVSRDGRAFVWRNDRRLFQYRFEARVAMISLGASLPILDHARAFVKVG